MGIFFMVLFGEVVVCYGGYWVEGRGWFGRWVVERFLYVRLFYIVVVIVYGLKGVVFLLRVVDVNLFSGDIG